MQGGSRGKLIQEAEAEAKREADAVVIAQIAAQLLAAKGSAAALINPQDIALAVKDAKAILAEAKKP